MTIRNRLVGAAIVLALASSTAISGVKAQRERPPSPRVLERIRKELATLPYYGVFDNLSFKLRGDTITLYGHVLRPTTKKDAERRVSRLEGIDRVINNIQVLPLSSFDDSIRRRTYRAVFGTASLYRYALGANPSIHIIVNRGHVTLEGVVDNKTDSQLAYTAARGVSGVFSVTNNLRIGRGD